MRGSGGQVTEGYVVPEHKDARVEQCPFCGEGAWAIEHLSKGWCFCASCTARFILDDHGKVAGWAEPFQQKKDKDGSV